MPPKNTLKDKLEDDVLDLSLMQLTEVPVEEIVSLSTHTLPPFYAINVVSEAHQCLRSLTLLYVKLPNDDKTIYHGYSQI